VKLAIFSDVHGNLEALTAVRDAIAGESADSVICLGDVVGYGANPNECCEIVREISDTVVLGNHDAAVCGRMSLEFYYLNAQQVLEWTVRRLDPSHTEWLASLPYSAALEGISLTHGSPLNPELFEYIFAIEHMLALEDGIDGLADVSFLGHSHLYRVFAFTGDEIFETAQEGFVLRRDAKYVISTGSVGQPRDFDHRSRYAVYDTTRRQFEIKKVEYDVDQAAARIIAAGLPMHFARRLRLGV
jgi:diadenosine tetraphosphatase ApaH/serine/threonine PP2A family protein phosphatase